MTQMNQIEDVFSLRIYEGGIPRLAKETGLSTITLYRLHNQGKLPFTRRLGRSIFIIEPLLQDWIKDGNKFE